MSNERDLSEKLADIADRLEKVNLSLEGNEVAIASIAAEIRTLSNEKYAPGNSQTWKDIKPKSSKKTYTDKSGRITPF